MKILSLFVALSIICIGLMALVAPDSFLSVAQSTVTPKGLYVIAGLRVIFGLVLLIAAAASRLPRTMRVVGAIALVAGLATPLFGLERARAIFSWSSVHGTSLIRVWGVIALAVGSLIAYAFISRHRSV